MTQKSMKTKIENIMFHIKSKTILGENTLELYVDLDYAVIEELKKMEGISIYAENPKENLCGVVSFSVARLPTEDVGHVLQESFDIRVRTGLHCAPLIHKALGKLPQGTVRVSFSAFNTHEEIDAFMQGLNTLLKGVT